jgi:hypothetical protein
MSFFQNFNEHFTLIGKRLYIELDIVAHLKRRAPQKYFCGA